jgi:hypothetical protein
VAEVRARDAGQPSDSLVPAGLRKMLTIQQHLAFLLLETGNPTLLASSNPALQSWILDPVVFLWGNFLVLCYWLKLKLKSC